MSARFGVDEGISLDAVVADATGRAYLFDNCKQIDWMVRTGAGVSAGTVVVECADSETFAGTWANLGTTNLATIGASAIDIGTFPAPQTARWVRTRVTGLMGGPVTTKLNGIRDSDH